MGMFSMRKPRRFHHEYIYANDRKQRLEAIEQRAKEELGLTEKTEGQDVSVRDADRFRGAFTPANSHLHQRGQSYGVAFGSRIFLFVAIFLFMGYVLFRLLLG